MIKKKPNLSEYIFFFIVLFWITFQRILKSELGFPPLLLQIIDMTIGIIIIFNLIRISYLTGQTYSELKNDKTFQGHNNSEKNSKLLAKLIGVAIILCGIWVTVFFPMYFGASLTTLVSGISISGFGLSIYFLYKK